MIPSNHKLNSYTQELSSQCPPQLPQVCPHPSVQQPLLQGQ